MPATAGTGAAASAPDRVVRPLSAEDLSILSLETETVAGHTCKVITLSGGIDLDRLRASIEARLDRAPELCMSLCEADGRPCWSSRQTDVDAHVVLQETAGPCDEAELRMVVADIFEKRLDRSRPLWRIDVVPQLADGGAALIWRIHHALADGSTAMRIAGSVLWDEQPQAAARRRTGPRRTQPDPSHTTDSGSCTSPRGSSRGLG